MMAWQRLAWIGGILAGLMLVGGFAGERVCAHAIVDAPNAASTPPPAQGRELRIAVGPPAAALAVRIEEPKLAPRATVFLLHGIRDRKESLAYWAERLSTAGYRAVLVDSRGHGHSSGQWLTYGVQEARDLSQLVDRLAITGPIAVMGVSYGGATAVEWAGRDRRVAAAVAVAPFASLRDIVPVYQRRLMPLVGALLPAAFTRGAIDLAGRMGGFDPDVASPADAASHAAAPILIVHGKSDVTVPYTQSEAILAHKGAARVTLVPLDGQDHDHIAADPRLVPLVLDFFAGVFK